MNAVFNSYLSLLCRLIIVLVCLCSSLPVVGNSSYQGVVKDVGIVLSIDPQSISVPTVELYRQVLNAARTQRRLFVKESVELSAHLAAAEQIFEGVPTVNRHSFIKNLPANDGGVNHQLQEMLDTLALEAALVTDCVPLGDHRVSSCSLYLYDRRHARIVASTTKDFAAGVSDPSLWATTLVGDLLAGMNAAAKDKELTRVSNAMQNRTPEEKRDSYFLESQAWTNSWRAAKGLPNQSPSLSLLVGKSQDSFDFTISALVAQAKSSRGLHTTAYEEQSLGLGFGIRANALTNVVWDLRLSAGPAKRQFVSTYSDENMATLTTESIRMHGETAVNWCTQQRMCAGLAFNMQRYVDYKVKTQNQRMAPAFAFGAGLRVRVNF